MIRAKVRRDGPGEWSWTLLDDHGDLVTGINGSWSDALGEVTDELRLMAETTQPPGVELPFADELRELHATADANERLLAELHTLAEPHLRVADELRAGAAEFRAIAADLRAPAYPDHAAPFGTLGDQLQVAEDARPAWKRWLGL